MSILRSFILPDEIIKDMKDKIKETRKLKIELGFALCTNKNSSVIVKGTECVGTKCSVKKGICSSDQTYIGNFHTHQTYPTMSLLDMISACEEEINCIGSTPFNRISCFRRKTEKDKCFNDIIPLESLEKDLLNEKENIIRTLKNPIAIAKKGVFSTIKDTYRYENEISKYHRNRLDLLHKHFDRFDIK
jgi:hypothetical protein